MPPRQQYRNTSFSFPRLRGVALTIVLLNVALSFVAILSGHAGALAALPAVLVLTPNLAVHGWIWQLFTYSFIDFGALSLLLSSLALWSFGSMLEAGWGGRRFAQLYFGSVIFAGLVAVGLSYTHVFGTNQGQQVYAAWGGVMGLVAAYGTAYSEQEVTMFLVPTPIKAKWMALVWIGFALFILIASRQAIALSELGGAAYGYIWVKFFSERRAGVFFSERYFGWRNRYYKWKRRRASRKFEVYMRKHDRSEYFDEYGNYRPPDEEKKGNGEAGKGRWVQ